MNCSLTSASQILLNPNHIFRHDLTGECLDGSHKGAAGLGISQYAPPAVGYAVERGEAIARDKGYTW